MGPGLPRQDSGGQVPEWFWNRTDPFLRAKPELLAGYLDPLLTLVISLNQIPAVYDIINDIAFLYRPDMVANPEQCILNAFPSLLNHYVNRVNNSMLNCLTNVECLPHLQLFLFALLTSFKYILPFRFNQRERKSYANQPSYSDNVQPCSSMRKWSPCPRTQVKTRLYLYH